MYSLLSAKALEKNSLGDWIDVDAGSQPLFQLFLKYDSLLIQVSNQTTMETGWATIYDFPISLRTSSVTLKDFLNVAVNGSIRIYSDSATETVIDGEGTPNYVRSLFTNDYGFTQKLINRNLHPDSQLAPDQMIDLLISHKDIYDYKSITDNALFTVNGLLHLATPTDQGIMIYEGGRGIVKGNDNRVGLLDFKALGGVTCYPFKSEYLVDHPEFDISRTCYIKFPFSLEGKSLLMSMGGFIQFIDPVIDVVGSNTVKINFRFIDLLSQYYANKDLIYRPDDFPISLNDQVPDYVNTHEVYTREFIIATLELSQTFFVLVNTPKISVTTKRLDKCDDPGIYRTADKTTPDLPVRIGHGFLPEYNLLKREHFDVLSCPHYMVHHAMRHNVPTEELWVTRNIDYSYKATDYAEASQLLITANNL